jgi:hypothetical protein
VIITKSMLLLLSSGINTFNADGHTGLHLAAKQGDEAVALALIAAVADVEAQSSPTGQTPLHLAAAGGHALQACSPSSSPLSHWMHQVPPAVLLQRGVCRAALAVPQGSVQTAA